jgi:HD-GYP domain-containing protein (c-di-GMP phosphodiesterase class II)
MKHKLGLSQVKAGDAFTDDVYIDDRNLLVPAGVQVKQKDLDMLQKWGVEWVYTDGEKSEAPRKESSGASTKSFAGDAALYASYSSLLDRMNDCFSRIKRQEKLEPKVVDQVSQDVVELVRDRRSALVSAIMGSNMQGYDLVRASVNCAILSVSVGITVKLPSYKISYLSTGALLHDVGMLRVPDSIVSKKGDLTEDETHKMRAHPLHSYKIVTKELLYPDDIGLIGLQHHERWDGEGYPRRTLGTDIDLLARIVSVADAFEAMVSEKPYRSSIIGYTAMKNLLSDNARRFDPDVLRSFIKSMGIYPIGSIVILNTSAIARVVDVHADAPMRPTVRVMVDEFGRQYGPDDGETVNLLAEKTLWIARAVDPKELLGG